MWYIIDNNSGRGGCESLDGGKEVPNHEKIKSQKEAKNSSTIRYKGQEGKSQLFFLQEDSLAAEDESYRGESSIWV